VPVPNIEWIEVDVGDDVVLDAIEVALDVIRRADPEEELLPGLRAVALEPDRGQASLLEQPVGPVGAEVEVVRLEGVPLGDERLVPGRVEAVGVSLGRVLPQQHPAACEEGEREQGDDAADDEQRDAPGTHDRDVTPASRRSRV
jgi:hypothetical protein